MQIVVTYCCGSPQIMITNTAVVIVVAYIIQIVRFCYSSFTTTFLFPFPVLNISYTCLIYDVEMYTSASLVKKNKKTLCIKILLQS